MNSLKNAHIHLHWPDPDRIINPPGSGPNVYAQLAKRKIEKNINYLADGAGVQIGVLTGNPLSDTTEPPIAIICEVPKRLSLDTLRQIHRLAWNFSRAPLLIIFEPHLIRAWTCCEPPPKDNEVGRESPEIIRLSSLSEKAARALDWVELASGQFFKNYKERFKRELCADYTLIETLDYVRQELLSLQLDKDICHDLLARVIFIQFLFHRKDSSGTPALSQRRLDRLFYEEGILSTRYTELSSILSNYNDSYAFFRWLNEKFNGDLFPGKGKTEEQRELEWQLEMKHVKPRHLELLSNFVSGRMSREQMTLWPMYSFDAIPLEFISSIYEKFVGKKPGVFYTPGHIVDFMLDRVLPWNNSRWNLKILDPACGSGIFLVKAYQRLIHRWKLAHPGEEPRTDILKGLLEDNLFGCDNDPHAVRVASFSLYLAMCDEIDPKYYWDRVKFPRLRDCTIVCADFFQEDKDGFRTIEDAKKYDLVIGNPPWGRNSKTMHASTWARGTYIKKAFSDEDAQKYKWETAYGDFGPLFMVKTAALTKNEGRITMLQPAMGMLFNRVGTALKFREKFFSTFNIEEITNLSALRFRLFKSSVSPVCIVTMQPTPPTGEPVIYTCPKPVCTSEDDYRIIIEPHDINEVYPHEAAKDPLVWTALMWGGRRDIVFLRRLENQPNIDQLEKSKIAVIRQGIIRGDREKRHENIVGKRIIDSEQFPQNTFLYLKAKSLPVNDDPLAHSRDSTDFAAFQLPQLILKQSWQKELARFRAAIAESDNATGSVLCSQSYISIHVKQEFYPVLEGACLSYNSKLAVYYLLLTSGRFSSYRPSINVEDLLRVPIPDASPGLLTNLGDFDDIDERLRKAFKFKDSEWALVEDLFDYTLPDFKGDISSSGRQKTRPREKRDELHLRKYCDYFLKVLTSGFGRDKNICATIFQEETEPILPVRLVAIHFNWPGQSKIQIQSINTPELTKKLLEIDKRFIKDPLDRSGGIFYRRVVRTYDTIRIESKLVPTIFIIKPDQIRYWTRSLAMRDADEVAGDIMSWNQRKSPKMDS